MLICKEVIGMQEIRSIALWGDSVMRGVVYDEQRGRYGLLPENAADRASRTLGLTLYNRSRMGCTVTKGLSIMKRDIEAGVEPQAALIEFGGNDCDYDWAAIAREPEKEHQPKTPLGLFTERLREMVALARQKGMRPVMTPLPPIHARRYFDFFTRGGLSRENILLWLGDVERIYRWHERYNGAVIQTARDCGVPLIDVRDAFLSERRYGELLCADGIHPNAGGHALIQRVLEGFGLDVQGNRAVGA